MFYHVLISITALDQYLVTNQTHEDVLIKFICPFVKREITIHDGNIFNMASYGSMKVYKTESPIDSDWPVKVNQTEKNDFANRYEHKNKLIKYISENEEDITEEIYREAIIFIEDGNYKEINEQILESIKGKDVFMICPFGNEEIDHNYEYVIKPTIKSHGYDIKRVDEISHTNTINDVILNQINKSRFIIADLTEAKPNCYYEVGYSHSKGKPVIILAKEGTEPHFDISTYKWNFWKDYKDLKKKFEKEISVLIQKV